MDSPENDKLCDQLRDQLCYSPSRGFQTANQTVQKIKELDIERRDKTEGRKELNTKSQTNNFDRLGDWRRFSAMMEEYIQGPQKKYGGELQFNDLCHYTGLRITLWNVLKYALRLWNGNGKEHDFEKMAHYSQMGWTLKEQQGREAPFFHNDIEGDYVVVRKVNRQA